MCMYVACIKSSRKDTVCCVIIVHIIIISFKERQNPFPLFASFLSIDPQVEKVRKMPTTDSDFINQIFVDLYEDENNLYEFTTRNNREPTATDFKANLEELLDSFLKSHDVRNIQADEAAGNYLDISLEEADMNMKHRYR